MGRLSVLSRPRPANHLRGNPDGWFKGRTALYRAGTIDAIGREGPRGGRRLTLLGVLDTLRTCSPRRRPWSRERAMVNLLDLFFGDGAWWFSIPALIGTFGYLVKLLLSSLGSDIDEGGFEGDSGATVLSFQGLATFAMGFGWGGLGAYRGAGWSSVTSVGVGVLCGAALVGILLSLINASRRLQSTGNITLDLFVGSEAETYTTIPAAGGGRGQIRAIINERQRIVSAISEGSEIPPRSAVTVVRANGDNTVTVRPR